MPTLQHSAVTGADLHGIAAFTFPTVVARDAQSVVAGDIGKAAHVTADNSFYVLTGVAPTTWSPIGGALATVAKTGAYADLTGTPTIPTVSAAGASGSYDDLTNKPAAYTLPVATASVLGGVKQGTNITIAGDGTISAPASAAGTLTGTTLAANVTASSLTSVGTLTSLAVTNTATAGTLTAGNISVAADTISSTNSTITLDPASPGSGGLVVINGSLQVTGTTTTIDSTTVTTNDLNIVVASNAINAAAATGAGLTVNPAFANATLTYTNADDRWNMNKNLNVGTVFGALSGNASTATLAATATALATARNINGVSFNGSADITVTAAAGTLTGTTLAANVTASGLTSVGTLGSLDVTNSATANRFIVSSTISGVAGSIHHGAAGGMSIVGKAGTDNDFTLVNPAVNTAIMRVPTGTLNTIFAGTVTSSNLSGTNTGDNATNTQYANDYRAANFVAGTNYQAPLVSGTSIKTINGTSVLGSGDLVVGATPGTGNVGYMNIPQVIQSAAYTLVLSDAGKHILHPSADTTARTFTIPANASVAFPIGTAVTFVNQNGAGVATIAITSDTMRLAGAGTTGNRTLAANGVATAIKLTATEWIISGTGLT